VRLRWYLTGNLVVNLLALVFTALKHRSFVRACAWLFNDIT